ncbi:MAG TPA: hypothetical protein VMC09_15365 [Anaerolineales bacterium]|nr:hypothetical protein [Anaerolineales bacterium]
MFRRIPYSIVFAAVLVLILASVFTALAATNSVPATHIGRSTRAITADTLKPAICSSLTLTAIVICPAGGGVCTGTKASELIIGSPNNDTISGGGGGDCILGGAGNDAINGGNGNDVCIGGPGVDTFKSCNVTQDP